MPLDYKAWPGPKRNYDLAGSQQFRILCELGLRSYDRVLDIGCGSLRLGRLLIPWLDPYGYHGVEPNVNMLNAAIMNEVSRELFGEVKGAHTIHRDDFNFNHFGHLFDYIMAQSIFSHATEEEVRECLCRAAEVMHGSSIFVYNYKKGRENNPLTDWEYPDTVEYTLASMRNWTERCGLIYEEFNVPEAPRHQIWVAARRREYGKGESG